MYFDDFVNVLDNRAIRYLWHPRVFLESEYSRSRPLPYVTFAISYAWAGLSLSWLRVWSLAIHLGSAVLVGLLYLRWIKGRWGALLAGVIFLLHPIAADSLIYFSARGALLMLFFLLLSLWIAGKPRQSIFTVAAFLLSSLAAFLSRETAVALVPLLLLIFRLEGRQGYLRLLFFPLLAGGLVLFWLKSGYISHAFRGIYVIQGEVQVSGPAEYLLFSLSLWPRIVGLFFSPGLQSIDHQVVMPSSLFSASVIGGALLWAFFLYSVRRAWLTRSFAWLFPSWFFVTLFFTNGIIPLLDPFAERHFYIALPAVAWCIAWLINRAAGEARHARVCAFCLLLVLAGANLFTLERVLDWSSPVRLWLDAHRKAPGKFRVAFNSAEALLSVADDPRGALEIFAVAFRHLKPGDLTIEQQETGISMAASALISLARERGKKAEELLGDFPPGYWRELVLLQALHGEPGWEKQWAAAKERVGNTPISPRARDPHFVENTFRLQWARHLKSKGRLVEALKGYESVILPFQERHSPYWTFRETLGDLYRELGRDQEALAQYEQAAYQYKVFKRFPYELQGKLHELYLKQGDIPRATDAIGEVVRVYTDKAPLRRLYADLLHKKKDRHAARQSREADFYLRHAVLPTDDREILKP